ncbi:hypothetical protein E0485_22870 [Paenibacillus albiflavus]|uniref:ATLF-like domain-containing protein n=1 Tax=Paenibacillus albiflavus TaxID=2545760 RepID=A0A4R4E2V1_9BACL|nr:hypothetical protein [Paenibacillus albiflavus]TCZ71074.1 hypothetical protein E0485_22870 [Paenibacillus albiflavus]
MKRLLTAILAITMILATFITAPALAETTNNDLVNKLVVLPTGDYNTKEANAMMDRLAKIPAPLLNKLVNKNLKVKLVNGQITDEPEFAQYKGVTPRGWENTGLTWDDVPGVSTNNVIVRIGYSKKGHGHNCQNLELHETMHAVDRMALNEISATAEFKELWKKEAKINYDGDGYVSVYPTEYFAEAASLYLLNDKTREGLKNDMPLTYDFMDKLFTNI